MGASNGLPGGGSGLPGGGTGLPGTGTGGGELKNKSDSKLLPMIDGALQSWERWPMKVECLQMRLQWIHWAMIH